MDNSNISTQSQHHAWYFLPHVLELSSRKNYFFPAPDIGLRTGPRRLGESPVIVVKTFYPAERSPEVPEPFSRGESGIGECQGRAGRARASLAAAGTDLNAQEDSWRPPSDLQTVWRTPGDRQGRSGISREAPATVTDAPDDSENSRRTSEAV